MASTYTKYRSGSSTFKLANLGYTYNRRHQSKGSTYWYCDQKSKCNASIVERDGKFSKGRKVAWDENGLHASHQPNIDRFEILNSFVEMDK
jgi:hypothetical protein